MIQRRHPVAAAHDKTSDNDEPVAPRTERTSSASFRRRKSMSYNSFLELIPMVLALVGGTVLIVGAVILIMRLMDTFFKVEHHDNALLPWNPLYQIPRSIESVGDRSDAYVLLRKEMDKNLPPGDADRSMAFVQDLLRHKQQDSSTIAVAEMAVHHSDQMTYDIYDCPDQPPAGYPFAWKLIDDVLDNWSVDQTALPSKIYQGLCVFDYHRDYDKALTYRKAELPFVVVNDPAVAEVVERWAQPGYLEQMLGPHTPHRTEYSESNHFMYYTAVSPRRRRSKEVPEGWKAPTQATRMTYTEWLKVANVTDENVGPDKPHWYFRLIGCGGMGNDGSCDRGSSEYLFDELTFFQPTESLYIVEPDEQKGIHCRFGMKGVIAENHWDGSRNAIALLGGSRRYILAHPDQCLNLAMYPKGHPSARHSATDWSHPRSDLDKYPKFADAMANEVVLQPGQVMYLPIYWFHFIISLELNVQCNTRSGVTDHYREPLRQCGF